MAKKKTADEVLHEATDKNLLDEDGQIDLSENAEKKAAKKYIMTPDGEKKVDLDRQESPLSTEKRIESQKKQILENAKRIDEEINALPEEERQIYIEESLKALGIPDAEIKNLQAMDTAEWTKSEIIKNLGRYVIEQSVVTSMGRYNALADWVSTVLRENGSRIIFYNDFEDADKTAGYSDVVIGDFNQGTNPTSEEVWYTNINAHKGYDLIDSVLNDVTRTTGLFVSLMQNLQLNITHPLEKVMYMYRLQFIAAPAIAASADEAKGLNDAGIDVTEDTADMTWNPADINDFLLQFTTMFGQGGEFYYATRDTGSKDFWLPKGFTTDIEIEPTMENTKIVLPIAVDKAIKNTITSKTFQLPELEVPKYTPLNYKKTFVEYGKVTGLMDTITEFDFFVEYNNPLEIMVHFEKGTIMPTPKLKSVYHQYMRIGTAVNKYGRVYKIHVKIGAAA